VPDESPEVTCDDGRDNDCDGLTDCLDILDCWSDPACMCIPDEIPEVSCDDDRDNDCDDLVDCLDPDCASSPDCLDNDTCGDALDISAGGVFRGTTAGFANDYSGSCVGRGPDAVFTITLDDYACVELNTFMTTWDTGLYVREGGCYGPEIGCNDDEPGHGTQSFLRFDVLDPGTYYVFLDGWSTSSMGEYALELEYCVLCIPSSWYESSCDNGIDEDCDELLDCEDPDCVWDPACLCIPDEWPERTCDDGRDNDCDDLVDCDDPDCGCCVPTARWEINCDNGIDEDCDYMVDCDDPDCDWDPACICIPTSWYESNCDNGIDEDCDDMIDCVDWDCWFDPACWGWP
jgi:hypothetical protein